MPLAKVIRESHSAILMRWEREARSLPASRGLTRLALLDHVPELLHSLVDLLEGRASPTAVDALAAEHAHQRLDEGYPLPQVVAEYGALRTAIMDQVSDSLSNDEDYRRILAQAAPVHGALDRAIATSVDHFAQMREDGILRERERLRLVVDTLPVGVWVTDAHGGVLMVNPEVRRIWGDVPITHSVSEFDSYRGRWPDGTSITAQDWTLARALRLRKTLLDEEMQVQTFDGDHKWLRCSAAPLFDDSHVVGAVCVNQDITEHKRLEEVRERFIDILGHDLRNPLNAITLGLDALEPGAPDRFNRVKTRLRTSAGRMKRLVDALLDFARTRSGKRMPIHRSSCSMAAIATAAADELRLAHPARNLRVQVSGDAGGDWDADRVSQVFSNLIANAIQHGEDPIEILVEGGHDEVEICVANKGRPIPADLLPHLFEPFQQGQGSREGLGLGLYIVREIVRAHGGRVTAASNEEGTRIKTTWPRHGLVA